MKKNNVPFVGLHAHSVAGSVFDGLGYPQEHMDFAFENGCDALALTDHGNMNGLAYQVLHAKKMQEEGKMKHMCGWRKIMILTGNTCSTRKTSYTVMERR